MERRGRMLGPRPRYGLRRDGELVIARFTPAGYEEVDCTHLLTPTTRTRGRGSNRWRNVDRGVLWAHPAFANDRVVAGSPLAG